MTAARAALTERLVGRPLAIHPGRLSGTLEAADLVSLEHWEDAGPASPFRPQRDELQVVDLRGPILPRGDWLTRALGWADHASMGELADELAADDSVRGVLLQIDSPGGDVQGAFEATAKWAALAAVKPVYAVADHNAYSAGYLYASTARKVFVSRAGGLGSVGVIAAHVDRSAQDTMLGLRYTFMTYGERKAEGNPHIPLSDSARASIQAEVDALGEAFVAEVAKQRRMSPEDVRGHQAATFMGQAAVDAGLADAIGTAEDARAALEAQLSGFPVSEAA